MKVAVEQSEVSVQVSNGEVRADIQVGREGRAATITVAEVETLPPSTFAEVENVGTENAAALRFKIPQGPVGGKGDKGDPGDIAANLDGGFF